MKPSVFLSVIVRESRGARMRMGFFVACLAVGVSAVVGVASLRDTFTETLSGQSRELLGADVVIRSRRPLPEGLDTYLAPLAASPVRTDLLQLPTMASVTTTVGDRRSRLVDLEAIDGEYPLRGTVELSDGRSLRDLGSDAVAVAPELLEELDVEIGNRIDLGNASFHIAASIRETTDRLGFSFAIGPRVLMRREALDRTGLVTFGSRVTYKALFRIDDRIGKKELGVFRDRIRSEFPGAEYLRIETFDQAQPMVRRSIDRVERYLGLVALLSLLLGGIGVAQIVRTWLGSRVQSIAILRCLGFRPREIVALYLSYVAMVALVGSLLGAFVGSLMPHVAVRFAPEALDGVSLPLCHADAVARGLVLGVSIALLFSLSPLTSVWKTPPARALRSSAVPLPVPVAVRVSTWLAVVFGVFASAWVQTERIDLALGFTVGLVVTSLLLLAAARCLLWLAGKAPRSRLGPYWRHGLAALARPGAGTTGALVALGLGILVVSTLSIVESRLFRELDQEIPASAPSVYLWDVQPSQATEVRDLLDRQGASFVQTVPVVMARLVAVGGVPVSDALGPEDRAGRSRWALTREQRITSLATLPDSNRLVGGELWSDPERSEMSLEVDFARRIGATLGSELRFDIQGVPIEFTVTSLREVAWRSFDLNFFLVAEPGTLDDAPGFQLVGASLPSAREIEFQGELSSTCPNVTVIRVRPILEKVQEILGRLATAVRLLGVFSIVVGLLIIAGAVSATTLRRAREAALLRALGLRRQDVAILLMIEYAFLGFVAGVVGVVASFGLAHGFLEWAVEVDADLPLWILPVTVAVTGIAVAVCGLVASARLLRVSPLDVLRQN